MAFFTSLIYHRPRHPPAMTGRDLARFIGAIRDAEVLQPDDARSLSVKFGDSIDQDENGTTWEEIDEEDSRLSMIREIEWDLERYDFTDLDALIDVLAADERRIYRAFASLGMPVDEVLRPITRRNSQENEVDFVPDSLSIQVGPIQLFDLASETPVLAAWIGVSLSGYGYLFPWTLREVVDRLEENAGVQRLMDVCRTMWPVAPEPPEPRIVELRREMGTLWPYDRLEKEWDWYWGVHESG